MTLANCKLYLEQATTEEDKKFWSERIARKYPTQPKPDVEAIAKPVEKPLKKEKKEVKE